MSKAIAIKRRALRIPSIPLMIALALPFGFLISIHPAIAAILFVITFFLLLLILPYTKLFNFILFLLIVGTIRVDGLLGTRISFLKDPASQVGGVSLDGLLLIGMVSLFLVLIACSRKYVSQLTKVPLSLFLFCLYALFSLVWTQWPIEGLRLIFKILYPLLLMCIIMASVKSRLQAQQIIHAILAALAFNVALGVVSLILNRGTSQYANPAISSVRHGTILLSAPPLALFLAFASFFALACYLDSSRKLYLALSGAGVVQLLFTLQRMAWLIFVTALLIYALMNSSKRSRLFVLLTISITLSAPILIPGFGERFSYHVPFLTWFSLLITDPISALQILNTSGRFEIYSIVIDSLIAKSPLFGFGAGTFQLATSQLIYLADGDGWRLLVDLGTVGSLLYALFVVQLLTRIHKRRHSLDIKGKWISCVAIAALVQYSLTFITDNPLEYYALFSQYVFAITALALIWPELPPSDPRFTLHEST